MLKRALHRSITEKIVVLLGILERRVGSSGK